MEKLALKPEEELDLLRRAAESLDRGAFFLAVCEVGKKRKSLMDRLEKELQACGREVWKVEFTPQHPNLRQMLEEQLQKNSGI